MNCIQPVNWEYCAPVHKWLFPAVEEYIELKKNGAYHSEREYLKELD